MMETPKNIAQYIEQAAGLIDLAIAPAYLPKVIDHFISLGAIASLVTEFPLADDIEIAPSFDP
jgi:hypothetical protein